VPSKHPFRQELEDHKRTESDVLRLVHHAHVATTQLFENAIVADGTADHGRNRSLTPISGRVCSGRYGI